MLFRVQKQFQKVTRPQLFRLSEREKASKEMEQLLPASWQGVSVYGELTHMFSAFRHQRHRQDLMWDKKGSKRGTSNNIQPTRISKWHKWARKRNDFAERKKKFKGWKRSEVSREKSPCVLWCRFEGSRLYFSVPGKQSQLFAGWKKHKHGKRGYLFHAKRTLINLK